MAAKETSKKGAAQVNELSFGKFLAKLCLAVIANYSIFLFLVPNDRRHDNISFISLLKRKRSIRLNFPRLNSIYICITDSYAVC